MVPVLTSDADPDGALQALKAEFRKKDKSKGFGQVDAAAAAAQEAADLAPITQEDKRWQLTAYDVPEWSAWLSAQKQSKGLDTGGVFVQVRRPAAMCELQCTGVIGRTSCGLSQPDVSRDMQTGRGLAVSRYCGQGCVETSGCVQIQLDGSVKSSGQGIPSFPAIIKEFPRLDDFRTQFVDGVGPAEE